MNLVVGCWVCLDLVFLDRVLAIHELGCWLLGMPRLSFLDRVLAIHELGCLLLVCCRGQPGGCMSCTLFEWIRGTGGPFALV